MNGAVFRYPVGWSVDQATGEISSAFGLQFGCLEAYCSPQLGSELVGNINDTLYCLHFQILLRGWIEWKNI